MTPNRHWFSSYHPYRTAVKVASGQKVFSQGIGTVRFKPSQSNLPIVHFENVLHIPDLSNSLISVMTLTKRHGVGVIIQDDLMTFKRRTTGATLFTAKASKDLPYLQGKIIQTSTETAFLTHKPTVTRELLHRRLCHPGDDRLDTLISKQLVKGLESLQNKRSHTTCEPCIKGKLSRLPFPKQASTRAENVGELVHSDLKGPMEPSKEGFRYWVTYIDDKSRYPVVYGLKRKSEQAHHFEQFCAEIKRQTGVNVQTVRDDKGGEYIASRYINYLKSEGIRHQTTAPDTPQQNGVAERFNRTASEAITAMLADSKLPVRFWHEALQCFLEAHVRLPSKATQNRTPYEVFYNRKPSIERLRVFGSKCYVLIPKAKRKALHSHAAPSLMLGYHPGTKAYRLWDPALKESMGQP